MQIQTYPLARMCISRIKSLAVRITLSHMHYLVPTQTFRIWSLSIYSISHTHPHADTQYVIPQNNDAYHWKYVCGNDWKIIWCSDEKKKRRGIRRFGKHMRRSNSLAVQHRKYYIEIYTVKFEQIGFTDLFTRSVGKFSGNNWQETNYRRCFDCFICRAVSFWLLLPNEK